MLNAMNILIVEDEAILAQRIQRLVSDYLKTYTLNIRIEHSLELARSYINTHPVDLLFLDLNLDGEDGFELLKDAGPITFPTIIISAYKEMAIDAFEWGVIDFVRKPVTADRLEKAMKRALSGGAGTPIQNLSIKTAHGVIPMPLTEIIYIQGSGGYSKLHTLSHGKILYERSLEKLESVLPHSFCRIHKSFIVQLQSIRKIHISTGSRYEAELTSGERIPIGRTYYKMVKDKLFI